MYMYRHIYSLIPCCPQYYINCIIAMWLYIFLIYEHCKLIDMSEQILVMVISSWKNASSSPG